MARPPRWRPRGSHAGSPRGLCSAPQSACAYLTCAAAVRCAGCRFPDPGLLLPPSWLLWAATSCSPVLLRPCAPSSPRPPVPVALPPVSPPLPCLRGCRLPFVVAVACLSGRFYQLLCRGRLCRCILGSALVGGVLLSALLSPFCCFPRAVVVLRAVEGGADVSIYATLAALPRVASRSP